MIFIRYFKNIHIFEMYKQKTLTINAITIVPLFCIPYSIFTTSERKKKQSLYICTEKVILDPVKLYIS